MSITPQENCATEFGTRGREACPEWERGSTVRDLGCELLRHD